MMPGGRDSLPDRYNTPPPMFTPGKDSTCYTCDHSSEMHAFKISGEAMTIVCRENGCLCSNKAPYRDPYSWMDLSNKTIDTRTRPDFN